MSEPTEGRVPITLTPEQHAALSAWVETTEHLYDCIGYSEGQVCCLDKLLAQPTAPASISGNEEDR